jgi:hypothetical protein
MDSSGYVDASAPLLTIPGRTAARRPVGGSQ